MSSNGDNMSGEGGIWGLLYAEPLLLCMSFCPTMHECEGLDGDGAGESWPGGHEKGNLNVVTPMDRGVETRKRRRGA